MSEPTITVRNFGGTGGATFQMVDDVSGADWKFKATNDGGFKIRDNANGTDVMVIEPNSTTNAVYIKSSGNVGIGSASPSEKLYVAGNILASGSITPGSSRVLKKEIRNLSGSDALMALNDMNPVTFVYKADPHEELHAGFIAEDVPEIIASFDRKGVDPMDVAAVLTRIIQIQQKQLEQQGKDIAILKRELNELKKNNPAP